MSTALEEAPVAEAPHEEFWDRYNKRFEFPISTLAAALIHLGVAALLVVILVHLMNGSPRNGPVPILIVPDLGLDDDGEGRPDDGGVRDPRVEKAGDPWTASMNLLPNPEELRRVEADIRRYIEDETGTVPISSANAAQYRELDETLRRKLLPPGAKNGSGTGPGRGDGDKKPGPGGNATDNSRARSLRWVLRFTTTDGRDYLDQLAAMGAAILVPLPPDNKDALLFPDLKDLKQRRLASNEDLKRLAGQVRFSDARPDSVAAVCGVLGVDAKPRTFWAFFPRAIEDELAKKEIGYRNRRPEKIEETVFHIRFREGQVLIQVVDQTPKK